MLKKTITYEDYDGVKRTETFYFNLSEAELTELELTHPGGFGDYVQRIVDAKDQGEIIKLFKKIIGLSYGIKSEDGRRFMKSEEISREFMETEAYNKLFMELATDDVKGAEFVNGVMPRSLMEQVEKQASDDLMERTRQRIEEKKVG